VVKIRGLRKLTPDNPTLTNKRGLPAMYYEEKVIDGILHCRSTSDGEWRPLMTKELTAKLLECRQKGQELNAIGVDLKKDTVALQKRIAELESEIRRIAELEARNSELSNIAHRKTSEYREKCNAYVEQGRQLERAHAALREVDDWEPEHEKEWRERHAQAIKEAGAQHHS